MSVLYAFRSIVVALRFSLGFAKNADILKQPRVNCLLLPRFPRAAGCLYHRQARAPIGLLSSMGQALCYGTAECAEEAAFSRLRGLP